MSCDPVLSATSGQGRNQGICSGMIGKGENHENKIRQGCDPGS